MKLAASVGFALIILLIVFVSLSTAAEWGTLVTDGQAVYYTPDQDEIDLTGGPFTITTRVTFSDTTQETGWILDKEGAYGFGVWHDGRIWYLRTRYNTSHISVNLGGPLTRTWNLVIWSNPVDYKTHVYIDGYDWADFSMTPWFDDNTNPLRVGNGLIAEFENLTITQAGTSGLGAQAVTCRADWEFNEAEPPYHDACGYDNALRRVVVYYFPVIVKK